MKIIRHIGSLAFVLGLFVTVFAGVPWHLLVADDPVVPWWLRIAVFCLLGGILVVLVSVAIEQQLCRTPKAPPAPVPGDADTPGEVMLLNSDALPGREVT